MHKKTKLSVHLKIVMTTSTEKNVVDVARELGRYSIDAFEFLQEGLRHTVEQVHGELPPKTRELYELLEQLDVDVGSADELCGPQMPAEIRVWVQRCGGSKAVAEMIRSRHVTGEQLCRGLRDLALQRWGLMASTVLRHWGIRSTRDFGRMVFALVENKLLRKNPHDKLEDFDDHYDFDEALDRAYEIKLRGKGLTCRAEAEEEESQK